MPFAAFSGFFSCKSDIQDIFSIFFLNLDLFDNLIYNIPMISHKIVIL